MSGEKSDCSFFTSVNPNEIEDDPFYKDNRLVYDEQRLSGVRTRANRIFLKPIYEEYAPDSEIYRSLPFLDKKTVQSNAIKISHMFSGFDMLAKELFERITYKKKMRDEDVKKIFPQCILDDGRQHYDACFSDIAFLHSLLCTLGINLVIRGSIFCIAYDGNHRSILSGRELDVISDYGGNYGLPIKGDWWSPYEISEEIRKEIGAEKVCFSFVRDCITKVKPAHTNVSKGPRSAADQSRERKMQRVLSKIVKSKPDMKATRAITLSVLGDDFAFSAKASIRIWDNFDKGHWKKSGPISKGGGISREELSNLIKSEK